MNIYLLVSCNDTTLLSGVMLAHGCIGAIMITRTIPGDTPKPSSCAGQILITQREHLVVVVVVLGTHGPFTEADPTVCFSVTGLW